MSRWDPEATIEVLRKSESSGQTEWRSKITAFFEQQMHELNSTQMRLALAEQKLQLIILGIKWVFGIIGGVISAVIIYKVIHS